MALDPIIRYIILAEDWERDFQNPRRINVFGLISNLTSTDNPAFPVRMRELCCIVAATECRGAARVRLKCIAEETGTLVFQTPLREVVFAMDPLHVTLMPFRIKNFAFPRPGMYAVQVEFNGKTLGDCPLRLR